MNPAPPVTIAESVHRVLSSPAYCRCCRSHCIEFLLRPDELGRSSTPASTHAANRFPRHEIGEAVAARVAVAADLLPVDVDVSDASLLELGPEGLQALAAGQQLDRLGVEDGVVEDS